MLGKNPPFVLMNLEKNDIMPEVCFKNYFSQKKDEIRLAKG